jgi:hypothetical protein
MKKQGLALLLLALVGCRTPLERHCVMPVARGDGNCRSEIKAEGNASTCAAAPSEDGVWLYRRVTGAQRDGRRSDALEVVYCPANAGEASPCRVGVVWATGAHGLGGPVVDKAP